MFRVQRHMLNLGPRPHYKLTRFVPNDVLAREKYEGETFHRIVREWERGIPTNAMRTGDANMEITSMPDGYLLILEIPDKGPYNV